MMSLFELIIQILFMSFLVLIFALIIVRVISLFDNKHDTNNLLPVFSSFKRKDE